MNTNMHLTLTALVALLAFAALGCDSAQLADDAPAQQAPTFATVDPTADPATSTPVDEAGEDVTLDDLAYTATTVGEMMPPDTTEASTTDEPAIDEPVLEETVVEEPAEEIAEEPATEPAVEPTAEPIAEIFSQGSEPVTWTPNGTFKLPAYGSGCRFTTSAVIQVPSNGSDDDSIVFETDAGPNATFFLEVTTPNGMTVVADVDMKRGLTGRSYRQANGEATWTDKDGEYTGLVVDGTLCFDEKLANGLDDVLAEFSLIVQLDGVYYTMGGNVLIEGALVTVTDSYAVEAPVAVDVDLR